MARRRKHHRRYNGMVSLSGLPLLDDSAKVVDIVVGAAIGVVAVGGIKAVLQKYAAATYVQLQTAVGPVLPALAGFAAGAALYFAEKGSNKGRATGHAAGAAVVGIALTVQKVLETQKPFGIDFSDVTTLNLNELQARRAMAGMLVADRSDGIQRGMNGMLVSDTSDGSAQLAALSMGDDQDGIEMLAGMN